jgi:hypothetical protein
MFTDEQEIISNINSDLEYTQGQLGWDEAMDEMIISSIRYKLSDGERLNRSIILQRSTGKLFKLEPVQISFSELTAREKEELENSVEDWNNAVPFEHRIVPQLNLL